MIPGAVVAVVITVVMAASLLIGVSLGVVMRGDDDVDR